MNLVKENAIEKETDQILENMQNNHKTGLLLTRKEVFQLCEKRDEVLVQCGRLELNGGIMEQLIDTFMDCPYITRDEFADVMEEVIEVFYTMKNECSDLIDDQHLMHYMRKQLDECHGVIVMMSDAVNEYCRKTVEKGIYEPAE